MALQIFGVHFLLCLTLLIMLVACGKAALSGANTSGHARLSVDGYEYARLYGCWYHLKALTPHRHAIQVAPSMPAITAPWARPGQAISSTVYVEQK